MSGAVAMGGTDLLWIALVVIGLIIMARS